MLNELIDKAKEKQGVKSDAALAEIIGVQRAAVSKWRKGYPMSQESAVKIARLCNEGEWPFGLSQPFLVHF